MPRFLLAELHLKALARKKSVKAIRTTIEKLSVGTDSYVVAYQDAMDRIQSEDRDPAELAMQALSWLACTRRTLSPAELQHALAVEIGKPELDLTNIPEVEDILSVCAGLIVSNPEANTIRLVHFTAQEYFERTRDHWFPTAEADIAARCGGQSNHDLGVKFIQSKTHVQAATGARGLNSPELKRSEATWQLAANITGAHLAAYLGLIELLRALHNLGHSMNSMDMYRRTHLSYAALRGHEEAVRMLASLPEVDVNVVDDDNRTPLLSALVNGHLATVNELMALEGVYKDRSKLLLLLAARDRLTGFNILTCGGKMDSELSTGLGHTVLSIAAQCGSLKVLKALINRGDIELDARDKQGMSPITLAVMNGNVTGQTPLGLAILEGNSKVFEFLFGQVHPGKRFHKMSPENSARKNFSRKENDFVYSLAPSG
ncbi:ankyrin repeat protein [Colletotrichum sojae]|uniref:Ankyrin repeat protein n=1 Tax=Colletotrichum sojae TaxID=2175907 RepID=A0A8H6IM38_9PEZI|nr:ankyrin repeat protein [Colletotrichum sojae]